MKKILFLFIALFLIPSVFSQEYVVTNIENNEKWFFRKEEIILPEIRGNLTQENRICKVEIRRPMDVMKIPTEKDKRERPEDIFDGFLVSERELVGFYKCSDIEITKNGDTHEEPKSIINFKTIIILTLIFIVVVGFMYALSLRTQHKKIIPLILFTLLLIPVALSYEYDNCTEWEDDYPANCQHTGNGNCPSFPYDICFAYGGFGGMGTANTTCFPYCEGEGNLVNLTWYVKGTTTYGYDGWYNVSVCGQQYDIRYTSTYHGSPPSNCSILSIGYSYYLYCNFTIPPSCNPQNGYNISFIRDSWGGIGAYFGISEVELNCYGTENWVNSVCQESHYTPPTEINYCDRLYLILDGGILVFLESILFFVMNLLLCLTPMYVFLFFVAIGGIILLIFKSFKKW